MYLVDCRIVLTSPPYVLLTLSALQVGIAVHIVLECILEQMALFEGRWCLSPRLVIAQHFNRLAFRGLRYFIHAEVMSMWSHILIHIQVIVGRRHCNSAITVSYSQVVLI